MQAINKENIKKVVLAYSGGLDTSIIIPWLKENYNNCEVIAVSGNVGQNDELEGLEEKAIATGASKLYVLDQTEEYVDEYIIPTMKAGAVYEDYLLGTSTARPCIAKGLVDVAIKEGADAICHGCTGKGNDQVRFELAIKHFAPNMPIIAPWRIWDIKSRDEEIEYAEAHNIPLKINRETNYSKDKNLWHLSHDALNDAKTIASNVVWTLCSDVGGNLWVGTSNGVSMSPRSQFFHSYPLPAITGSHDGNQMRLVYQDSDSTLWLGGNHGLIAIEGFDTEHQSCRWYKMNDPQWPIPHNSIRCMLEDDGKRLWVGIDGALLLYDRTTRQFRQLRIDGDRRNWVYDITETSDRRLQVTTYQATYVIDPESIASDGLVAVLQRENALPYTPQGRSAVTPAGTWNVTDEGLRITDARQQLLGSFSTVDSYTAVYYNPQSQTIWLGGIDKFAAVKADILRHAPSAVPVVTNVEVMGQGYCDALQLHQRRLQLSHDQNCLLFYLSDYDYGTEKATRFAFRVDGLQNEWVQLPTGSSTLLLSGLQPGSYTLYLSDAQQPEAKYSLHFRIRPPWYHSRLAVTIYILLLFILLTLVGLYLRSRRTLRQERKEKERILQSAKKKEAQLSEDKAMLEQELRLSMLAAAGDDTELSQDDQLLLRLTHIIEENIDNSDLSVDMLSQASGISSKQIYRKIKQLTGRTAIGYIRHLRLQKAARLLASAEHFSTKEVMYLTGFSNASYFTRSFQEEFGVTPSNYSKSATKD